MTVRKEAIALRLPTIPHSGGNGRGRARGDESPQPRRASGRCHEGATCDRRRRQIVGARELGRPRGCLRPAPAGLAHGWLRAHLSSVLSLCGLEQLSSGTPFTSRRARCRLVFGGTGAHHRFLPLRRGPYGTCSISAATTRGALTQGTPLERIRRRRRRPEALAESQKLGIEPRGPTSTSTAVGTATSTRPGASSSSIRRAMPARRLPKCYGSLRNSGTVVGSVPNALPLRTALLPTRAQARDRPTTCRFAPNDIRAFRASIDVQLHLIGKARALPARLFANDIVFSAASA